MDRSDLVLCLHSLEPRRGVVLRPLLLSILLSGGLPLQGRMTWCKRAGWLRFRSKAVLRTHVVISWPLCPESCKKALERTGRTNRRTVRAVKVVRQRARVGPRCRCAYDSRQASWRIVIFGCARGVEKRSKSHVRLESRWFVRRTDRERPWKRHLAGRIRARTGAAAGLHSMPTGPGGRRRAGLGARRSYAGVCAR